MLQLQLLGEQNPTLFLLITLIYVLLFLVFILGGTRIQVRIWLLQVGDFVRQIEMWSEEGKKIAVRAVRESGGDREVAEFVERMLDFVFIEPVERDPVGVLKRLEHLLDVRRIRFRGLIGEVALHADAERIANLEMVLEAASALRQLFFILRHYYIMSKESGNIALVSQLQVMIPFLSKIALAYREALNAFYHGKPIGDGAGALVASLLVRELKGEGGFRDFDGELVRADAVYKGREVIILRAKGPGGRVGKPGDGVLRVLKEKRGKVKRVIMIDAGLKFEGEDTGKIVEGVGAAIGGPGVDKYKIEVGAVEGDVAIDAVVIKMSLEEALTTMKREIVKGVVEAKERVKEIIERFTNEGDAVVVVGVGNCIGIGN